MFCDHGQRITTEATATLFVDSFMGPVCHHSHNVSVPKRAARMEVEIRRLLDNSPPVPNRTVPSVFLRVAYATASTVQFVSGMSYMAAIMLVREPVESLAYATLVTLLQV